MIRCVQNNYVKLFVKLGVGKIICQVHMSIARKSIFGRQKCFILFTFLCVAGDVVCNELSSGGKLCFVLGDQFGEIYIIYKQQKKAIHVCAFGVNNCQYYMPSSKMIGK